MSRLATKPLRWIFTAAVLFLIHGAAYAQATRTWVSGVGDDANPCSRTAPCKTFAGAISKTATGGEIDTLDPGGFGAVTITHAMTIQTDPSMGGILSSGTNGITVNITTGSPTDVVTIRGMSIQGTTTGINGIRFLAGAALHVENCRINGHNGASSNGILFAPSSGLSRLYVSDTYIDDNGDGTTNSAGINIAPTGTGIALSEIDHVHVNNNKGFGIRVGDNGFATIREADVNGSKKSGVAAFGSVNASDIVLTDSVIADDGIDATSSDGGILSSGAFAFVHMSNNVISENTQGLRQLSSGKIMSYGNNKAVSNTANGTPTGAVTPQL